MGPDECIRLVEQSRSGDMVSFEKLMFYHYPTLHRYVACRIDDATESDDVLQDVLLLAWLNISRLRIAAAFRQWLMRIAGNCCNRWYKTKPSSCIPVDNEMLTSLADYRQHTTYGYAGDDNDNGWRSADGNERLLLAIDSLPDKQRHAIKDFYFNELKISEIAFMHNIPEGTVKRRLHDGRQSLRKVLEDSMKERESERKMYNKISKFKGILPFIRPEIEITPKKDVSFDIVVNEVPWMYCSLKVGDETTWGIYDAPGWELTDCCTTRTFREAVIHSIECVQIELNEYSNPRKDSADNTRCLYIHTDERHIQYVAASSVEKGRFKLLTLFDDEFIKNFSVDFNRDIKNTGFSLYLDSEYNKVHVTTENKQFTAGAGVFDVRIGDRVFECLRVLDIWRDSPQILVENYMSREGRSILFRRYNHPLWKIERYGQRWDEKLPDASRLYINGEEYVHWYDCLSDTAF